jgi:hypothetical protein
MFVFVVYFLSMRESSLTVTVTVTHSAAECVLGTSCVGEPQEQDIDDVAMPTETAMDDQRRR